jgi:hypothetical protein
MLIENLIYTENSIIIFFFFTKRKTKSGHSDHAYQTY